MDISRYSHYAVAGCVVDLLYLASGMFMRAWIGMTLGMERTEKQKIAGLRTTIASDRHSNSDRVEDRSNVLDVHFGMHQHNSIGST